MTKTLLIIVGIAVLLVAIAGMYKFNYLASQPGYDVDGNKVEQNFEGETNPDTATLFMQPWTWSKTIYNNDTEIVPNQTDAFTLTFKEDGSVSATTDCNSMSGAYEILDKYITIGPIMMTRMFCENSQEQEFAKILAETQSFFFTSKGELIFELKFDTGSVIFH